MPSLSQSSLNSLAEYRTLSVQSLKQWHCLKEHVEWHHAVSWAFSTYMPEFNQLTQLQA